MQISGGNARHLEIGNLKIDGFVKNPSVPRCAELRALHLM
jgi:hypothetical protein